MISPLSNIDPADLASALPGVGVKCFVSLTRMSEDVIDSYLRPKKRTARKKYECLSFNSSSEDDEYEKYVDVEFEDSYGHADGIILEEILQSPQSSKKRKKNIRNSKKSYSVNKTIKSDNLELENDVEPPHKLDTRDSLIVADKNMIYGIDKNTLLQPIIRLNKTLLLSEFGDNIEERHSLNSNALVNPKYVYGEYTHINNFSINTDGNKLGKIRVKDPWTLGMTKSSADSFQYPEYNKYYTPEVENTEEDEISVSNNEYLQSLRGKMSQNMNHNERFSVMIRGSENSVNNDITNVSREVYFDIFGKMSVNTLVFESLYQKHFSCINRHKIKESASIISKISKNVGLNKCQINSIDRKSTLTNDEKNQRRALVYELFSTNKTFQENELKNTLQFIMKDFEDTNFDLLYQMLFLAIFNIFMQLNSNKCKKETLFKFMITSLTSCLATSGVRYKHTLGVFNYKHFQRALFLLKSNDFSDSCTSLQHFIDRNNLFKSLLHDF